MKVPENTASARNITHMLFLSRLLVLKCCLQIPDCHLTFPRASWAILRVCPHRSQDVFSELFPILRDRLKGLTIFESALRHIVQDEIPSVWESLATHSYPTFSRGAKLRVVVDEAQILSNKGSELFQSSFAETYLQSMLSILSGVRSTGSARELAIIYCGTGLSIRTLH